MLTTKNDEELFLYKEGSGPDIILLHSWCGSHLEWKKILPHLSQTFTIYALDIRGHGNSQLNDEADFSLEAMADDLNDLIMIYNLNKPKVIAHSMGAFMLWKYIEKYGQEHLSSLCILDQTAKLLTDDTWPFGIYGNFNKEANDLFICNMKEDFAEHVIRLGAMGHNRMMNDKYQQNDETIQAVRKYLSNLNSYPLIEIWKSLTQSDFRQTVTTINLPCLLIFGGDSNYYGKGIAQHMHSLYPNSEMHIYEGADHSPHLRNTERFCDEFNTFALAE